MLTQSDPSSDRIEYAKFVCVESVPTAMPRSLITLKSKYDCGRGGDGLLAKQEVIVVRAAKSISHFMTGAAYVEACANATRFEIRKQLQK